MHDQIKKHVERKKEKKREFINRISSLQNLLGEEHDIPVKSIDSSNGTYIQ